MTANPLPIHQIIPGAGRYDAITAQARHFQRWLQLRGFTSDLFAPHIEDDPDLQRTVKPLTAFPRGSSHRLIYHHSLGLPEVLPLLTQQPTVLVYHNITPAAFFTAADPANAHRLQQGRQQLAKMAPDIALAVGDSAYNLQDLNGLGYAKQTMVPIVIDGHHLTPAVSRPLTPPMNLLFVGRIAPNKRQEDLVRLLAHCRTLDPDARLTLIGKPEAAGYSRWLDELIVERGLKDFISRPGQVDDDALRDAYQQATVYVSMSEHEGFGKPLIEAMRANVPVVALAAAAVPETMGKAGILFTRKDFSILAELLAFLHQPQNQPFVDRLLSRQRARAADFAPPAIEPLFWTALESIGWL